MISNPELDRLIAELRTHPLADGELRQVKEGVYVSLSQSEPEGLEHGFCLSVSERLCPSAAAEAAPIASCGPVADSGECPARLLREDRRQSGYR